jgi:hypothetical protein
LQSFTIEPPAIDFSGLAKLYGMSYVSAKDGAGLQAFLARAAIDDNVLLELQLDTRLKPVTAARHF